MFAPLPVTAFTGVNCLGGGVAAWQRALAGNRSGLAPCAFEDVRLPTWIGEVPELDEARLDGRLADFDCRNNRLAELGLAGDGFVDAVEAARRRHGPQRIAVVMGTSTSGVLSTERAYQRRDQSTGALPPDFRYLGTQNNYSLAAFVRARLELQGPAQVI